MPMAPAAIYRSIDFDESERPHHHLQGLASGGFADDARNENGAITLSDRPGIGFESQAGLFTIMREWAER